MEGILEATEVIAGCRMLFTKVPHFLQACILPIPQPFIHTSAKVKKG
jgi:hypothetical protein